MRLILATQGTYGDHLPMAGLASTLKQRKFEVRLACNPAMHSLARRSDIDPITFGEALGPSESSANPLCWDHWQNPPVNQKWTEENCRVLREQYESLVNILRPGDVLVGCRNQYMLSLVAQVCGCQWLEVGLNCGSMIDYKRLPMARDSSHPWKHGLDQLEAQLRQEFLGNSNNQQDPDPLLRLHAVPDMFAAFDYPQVNAIRTGFWCWQDPQWQDWKPPLAVDRALKNEPPPLGLVFSSQPLHNPKKILAQHLEVAELLGLSLILVRGWAFHEDKNLGSLIDHPALIILDPLPLPWLLSRLSAVFVHGGIGTLAEAIRADCQVVVEPFGNDQFLNARLALQQGLALAVHPHRFNPTIVAKALMTQVKTRTSMQEPSMFAGLSVAATEIEKCLK